MSKSLFAVALAAMTLVPLAGAFAKPDALTQAESPVKPAEKKKKTGDAIKKKPAAKSTTEDYTKKPTEGSMSNPSGESSLMKSAPPVKGDPASSSPSASPSASPSDSMSSPGGSMSAPGGSGSGSSTGGSSGGSMSEPSSPTAPTTPPK